MQNEIVLKVKNELTAPDAMEQFKLALGSGANSFISSVLIAVADNPKLAECSPTSIVNSALRAASLELSCDPAQRQGFIIPRMVNKELVARFQPHYNGLYTLAQRTGKYWFINVSPIYEGQDVYEDVYTGLHVFKIGDDREGNPIFGAPESVGRYRKANESKGKVIGYLGYFKTKKGFEKSVYMTIRDIYEHAEKYSEAYKSDVRNSTKFSPWFDPKKKDVMEMKTCLLALLRWADTSGTEGEKLKQAMNLDNEMEIIDSPAVEDLPIESVMPGPKLSDSVEELKKVFAKEFNAAMKIVARGTKLPSIGPRPTVQELQEAISGIRALVAAAKE